MSRLLNVVWVVSCGVFVAACSGDEKGADSDAVAGAGSAGGSGSQAGGASGAGVAGSSGAAPDPDLDPAGDADGDGIDNADERELSLDPEAWDSDDDGFSDLDEVVDVASPRDTDGDGVIDALESDLADNDLDGTVDTTDPGQGWQVAAGRFYPSAIASDGSDATRIEVVITGAGVTRVALSSPPNFYDPTVLPDEVLVDGEALGDGELELFDDGSHGDRQADDGIWSRGGITTQMPSRAATGSRDWVVFLKVLVSDPNGDEERYLGIPAGDTGEGATLQRSLGFYLAVVDPAALVMPKVVSSTLQKTPHLINIVDPAAAVALKRRFSETTLGSDPSVPDIFRPVLEAIPGDVDFVAVFPASDARGRRAGTYLRASVDAEGTGLTPYPPAPSWGSEDGEVKGGIVLDFSLHAPLNHEIMHHWGVFLSPSLGFISDGSHWGVASTYGVLGGFDPDTFVDLGDGTYSIDFFSEAGNDWNTTPFSPMELYLAGLAPASEIEPIITMQDAMPLSYTDTAVIVEGTPQTVTIEQIVATSGARLPSAEDSQKAFTMAFAVYSEQPLSAAEMSWLDLYADFFGRRSLTGSMSFYEATSGRATMTTALPKLVGE